MSQNVRKFKRGEHLFHEGDRPDNVYIIQSGRVSVYFSRGQHRIEIMQLHNSQMVGEASILVSGHRPYSAEATSETTAIEIPLSSVRAQLDALPDVLKILFKSLHEKVKNSVTEIRNHRMEKETAPCPQMVIPKLFSILNFVGRYLGQKDGSDLVLSWLSLNISTVRLFLESTARMQGVIEILTKLGFAKMEMIKNSEGIEEIEKVILHNIQLVEDFAEFYQYNLYKGSRAEVIYLDPLAHTVATALVMMAKDKPVDRKGIVELPFNSLVEDVKKQLNFTLKPNHFDFLEKKGLFVKRINRNETVVIAFELKEFEKIVTFWDIIHEIDRWNEKGKVDMKDKYDKFKKMAEAGSELCPSCQQPVTEQMKFCANCGHKLVA